MPGVAVFMTAQPRGTPAALAHKLRYNKVIHEHGVNLLDTTQPVPHVAEEDRITVREFGHGISDVLVRYGFMEDPNVPEALALVWSRIGASSVSSGTEHSSPPRSA